MKHKPITQQMPALAGMYVTRKMRTALRMIFEDSHYICEWQTIVRLTEAGFVSYIDGRACITEEGKDLLSSPGPKVLHKPFVKTKMREWEGIAKKYDRYG